ncbi:hypothetical protein GCM10027168_32250 [Streptomyces capparidis]
MTEQHTWSGPSRRSDYAPARPHTESANLADILERVLDKGIVIAGDIRIDLLDIELLTIRIRLLVASVDRAREMGIDWWEHDPSLSSGKRDVLAENRRLRRRVGELEAGGEEAALEPAHGGRGARRRREDGQPRGVPEEYGPEEYEPEEYGPEEYGPDGYGSGGRGPGAHGSGDHRPEGEP